MPLSCSFIPGIPRLRALFLLSFIAFFLSVLAPVQSAASSSAQLGTFLEMKQRELDMLNSTERSIADAADQRLEEARAEYTAVKQQFGETLLAQRLSLAYPIEGRAMSRQLESMETRLRRTTESLRGISEQAAVRRDRLSSATTRDIAPAGSLSPDMQALVDAYTRQTASLRSRLDSQQEKADSQLKQATALLEKITAKRIEREAGLAASWQDYFFRNKEPLLSVELWKQPGSLPLWLSIRTASLMQELLIIKERAVSALLLTLFVLSLAAGGGIPLLRAGLRAQQPAPELAARLHRAGFIGSLGFALVVTDMRVFSGAAPAFSVFCWFLFGLGVLMGSNAVRKLVLPDFINISKAPVAWLFLLGGAILVSEMPGKLVVPLWTSTLVLFMAYMIRRHRQANPGPLALNVWFWMGILFTLLAVGGYGRFSAFLCMFWFTAYVAYGVSAGLLAVLGRSMQSLPDEGSFVMVKGLVMGTASPLIWTGSAALGFYWLYQFLGEGILRSVGDLAISWQGFSLRFASVLLLATLFYVARACVLLARGALDRMALRWPREQRGTVLSLKTMATYGIWGLYGLVGLNILGVSLTSLTVVAGGLSVGIGFGMQTIFNNFFSGLILLFGRSIQQGDIIQVDNLWCVVRTISIRATVVETFDNASLIIPNSQLVTSQVTNWTKNNATIRRDLLVGVAYGSDTELVRQTLLRIASENPFVLPHPAPAVIFSDFGASSLDFILRVWINDIDNSLRALSDLRFAVDRAFREAKIEIAFPQMDLHIRSAPGLQQLQAAPAIEAPEPKV